MMATPSQKSWLIVLSRQSWWWWAMKEWARRGDARVCVRSSIKSKRHDPKHVIHDDSRPQSYCRFNKYYNIFSSGVRLRFYFRTILPVLGGIMDTDMTVYVGTIHTPYTSNTIQRASCCCRTMCIRITCYVLGSTCTLEHQYNTHQTGLVLSYDVLLYVHQNLDYDYSVLSSIK